MEEEADYNARQGNLIEGRDDHLRRHILRNIRLEIKVVHHERGPSNGDCEGGADAQTQFSSFTHDEKGKHVIRETHEKKED
mmetsp:Transcript_17152/g.33609  ORF Transcript_17152/g.33609 Transcript_17152/m.33609 type:complete len:81 (+) Transcript_17152:211-453(+)